MLFIIDHSVTVEANAERLERTITRTLATRGERMETTYLMIRVPGEHHRKTLAVGMYDIILYLRDVPISADQEAVRPELFGLEGNNEVYVMFEKSR
jgi:hypothetical protein